MWNWSQKEQTTISKWSKMAAKEAKLNGHKIDTQDVKHNLRHTLKKKNLKKQCTDSVCVYHTYHTQPMAVYIIYIIYTVSVCSRESTDTRNSGNHQHLWLSVVWVQLPYGKLRNSPLCKRHSNVPLLPYDMFPVGWSPGLPCYITVDRKIVV